MTTEYIVQINDEIVFETNDDDLAYETFQKIKAGLKNNLIAYCNNARFSPKGGIQIVSYIALTRSE